MKKLVVIAILLQSILISSGAYGVEPDEVLADPVLEARARAISKNLRCVICQSENIDESNAPLAKDLRVLVRQRLLAGDTDAQIFTFMTDRYGDYVLMRPPFQRNTLFLWIAPFGLLVIASGVAIIFFRKRAQLEKAKPLSDLERKKIDELLK